MRPSTTPARRPWRSGLAAVLVLVGGILAEGLHTVLEPHRWCAVHEALEHGEETEEHHTSEEGPSVADADSETAEHERCRLVLLSRDDAALALAAAAPALPVLSVGPAVPPRASPRAPRVPRYRLAPKQSPPAA